MATHLIPLFDNYFCQIMASQAWIKVAIKPIAKPITHIIIMSSMFVVHSHANIVVKDYDSEHVSEHVAKNSVSNNSGSDNSAISYLENNPSGDILMGDENISPDKIIFINSSSQNSMPLNTLVKTAAKPQINSNEQLLLTDTSANYKLQNLADPSTQIILNNTYSIDVPSALSLSQAQQVLLQVSPKLAANNAAIAASEYQSQATQTLDQPWVFFQTQATHYNIDADVDLSRFKTGVNKTVNNAVNGIIGNISPSLPPINIPPIVSSTLPDTYNFQRDGDRVGANLALIWPVYTAGKMDSLTGILDARTQEAQADALMDSDELYTTLIERYFTAQLAIIAAYLREDALQTVEETEHMAQRLLEEGFISKVDYLEANVALAEAKSEASKARNDAKLAMTALQGLLRTPYPIKPTTPLFVSSTPLPTLTQFQEIALAHHPGLQKIDAKYQQAQNLKNLSNSGLKPNIAVYGLSEIDNNPSWLVGVAASWKLWGGLDQRAQFAAGDAKMRQALLSKVDVSDNIMLLVEKNWQTVENARVRYLSLNNNVNLAEELLNLKQLGLAEGLNTALDVTTAQTKYLKARTDQAVAANDYVQALAALMQSCGTPFAFNDYMNNADIRLPQLY